MNLIYGTDRRDGIVNLMAACNARTMLEVGVLHGNFGTHILLNSQLHLLIGIDINITPEAIANNQQWQKKWLLIEGDSRQVAKQLKGYRFDIIYLDGGHTREIMKADLENFYPMLKNGGILCGDDYDEVVYDNETCGVIEATDEFAKGLNKKIYINTVKDADWDSIYQERLRRRVERAKGKEVPGQYFYFIK